MFVAKKKTIGGRKYYVTGSTIDRHGVRVVEKSYTTNAGKVIVRGGIVHHPNGDKTPE